MTMAKRFTFNSHSSCVLGGGDPVVCHAVILSSVTTLSKVDAQPLCFNVIIRT